MNITIYTLHFHCNYGGILQSFALTKVLEKQGHKVLVSTCFNVAPLKVRPKRKIKGVIKWFLMPILIRLGLKKQEKRRDCVYNYSPFYQTHFPNALPVFHSTAELKKFYNDFKPQVCITGSDQVWRRAFAPNIYNSFLDFADKNKTRKVAYAASFGVDHWELTPEETERCAQLIQEFSIVSTREDSGVDLCRQYLHKEAFHVLDPTLLAGPDVFRPLFKDLEIKGGVFSYVLDENPNKQKMLDTVCQTLQMQASDYFSEKTDEKAVFISPNEWVGHFANCDFVFTDSFHGTCFAIMFNKPFVAIYNAGRGNARFTSLLKSLDLMDRLVDESADVTALLNTPIDYDRVNRRLEELREFSMGILNKGIYGSEAL